MITRSRSNSSAANLFSKLQTTYAATTKINACARPSWPPSAIGAAQIYDPSDRDEDGDIDDVDRTLPISERFFSGGSTTLRGFGFEEAGPRVAIVPNPNIKFFNNDGEQVTLNPYLVPIGGNAFAVVNLEARVSVTKNVQLVPFYDGGNVFPRVGDIFGRDADLATTRTSALAETTAASAFASNSLRALSVDY